MPLSLSRKPGETIRVGSITITIRKVSRGRVVVSIDAPRDVAVRRGELQDQDQDGDQDQARARELYDEQAKERQKRKSQSVVETLPPQNHEKARDAAGKAADQNQALARRKELYEALHPEAAKGGDRKSEDAEIKRTTCPSVPSFAADTAAKTGQSERQVRRDDHQEVER